MRLKKVLWACLSIITGMFAGICGIALGIIAVASIFDLLNHGKDKGLGGGVIIGWYGLALGVAIGAAVTILLARWIYRQKSFN